MRVRTHALHALVAIALPAVAAAQTVEWVRQFGDVPHDRVQAVAVAASMRFSSSCD